MGITGALIAGGATLGAAALSSSAAANAAGAQIGASQQAQTLQAQQLADQIGRLSPYATGGNLANAALLSQLGLGGTPGGYKNDWSNPLWAAYAAQGGYGAPGGATTDTQQWQNLRNQIASAGAMNIDSNAPGYGALTKPITQDLINQDPVYANGLQFGLNQGNRAIQNSALANGGYDSGATLKALTRFANDYGTSKTQAGVSDIQSNRAQQYGFLSGQQAVGLNAAAGQNLATGNYANAASNLITGAGNAAAAGIVGGANAYSGVGTSLGNLYNNYNNSQLLKSILSQNNLSAGTGFTSNQIGGPDGFGGLG